MTKWPRRLAATMVTLITACSSGGNSNTGGGNTDAGHAAATSYFGAGSEWNVTFNPDGTAVLTHSATVGGAADLTVNGTYGTYPTGFGRLTVTSTSGAGSGTAMPPAVGDTYDGLEVPGSAFFLQTDAHVLTTMIPAGACPTAAFHANWIMVLANAKWSDMSETFGELSWDPTTNTANTAQRFALRSFMSVGPGPAITSVACTDGVAVTTDNAQTPGESDLFLNAAGGAIIHGNVLAEATHLDVIAFAMPATSTAAPADLAGSYGGFVFSPTSVTPVSLTLAVSGGAASGTAAQLSDVSTGATVAGMDVSFTLNAVGPLAGSLTGTLGSAPLVCNVQENANGTARTILACGSSMDGVTYTGIVLASH